MGFSFSRSVKFGPLRVNVSKRGVGLSAGVKGARVAVGPRGTYVTLGRGGFRYQTKVGGARVSPAGGAPRAPVTLDVPDVGRIQTASTSELAEASPDTVLDEIQKRVHRFNWFKAYVIVWCMVGLPLLATPPVLLALVVLASVPGCFLYRWNRERRTACLFYDVDNEEIVLRLAACNAAGEALSQTTTLWHIYSSVATADRKRNAGASALVRRTPTTCHSGSLPGIELNVEPWSITVGPQQLLFLPDRLLVHENKRFAAVPYEQLSADYSVSNFVEEERVPADARQVDVTWRYVNKSGGPDRRFNDNRQLPVLQYGRLTLRTPSGMTILLESSNADATLRAQQVLLELQRLAREPVTRIEKQDRGRADQHAVPSGVQPRTEAHRSVLSAAAVVLRFLAAADRRVSDDEVEEASSFLSRLFDDPSAVAAVVAGFRTISSNDVEARIAAQVLVRHSESLAREVLSGAETIALADGRVTPKERERMSQLKAWMQEASQVPA